MPVIPPLSPENATPPTREVYEQIRQSIGQGQVPLGYQMMGHVEAYLQDSFVNARGFIHDGTGGLDEDQRTAIVLAASSAMACVHCVRAHAKEAQDHGWTTQRVAEVLAVTATCAMYNVYFKFRDLSGNPAFEAMTAGLSAQTFHKTSLDARTVELIGIVVSNINSCGVCTAGHIRKALALGLTHQQIDEAVKISAVMASFNTYHRTQ